MLKFGIQNGLNVARLGLTEDQILTACSLADKTGYHSIWYMDYQIQLEETLLQSDHLLNE